VASQRLRERLFAILTRLNGELDSLEFADPVTHVYNPLLYAEDPASQYLDRFLCGPGGRLFLLGMNPGPWGMAQTGVPFGEIEAVRDWLKIQGSVGQPQNSHPKRPVQGFDCSRSEVSGRRLWGYFAQEFPSSEAFAKKCVVFNYCPLIFLEESGRNRTPDKLPKAEREPLFAACDECLVAILRELRIERAIGIGQFAYRRLTAVKDSVATLESVESIIHPSPANPHANRGWAEAVSPVLKPSLR